MLADVAHHSSEAKLRAQRHRKKELQKEIDRDERRGGDRSYAAWEARQQAAKDEFKRSTQEPEVPAAMEPGQPLEQELSEFMKKKLGIGVLTNREKDELAVEQGMASEGSDEAIYNDNEMW